MTDHEEMEEVAHQRAQVLEEAISVALGDSQNTERSNQLLDVLLEYSDEFYDALVEAARRLV